MNNDLCKQRNLPVYNFHSPSILKRDRKQKENKISELETKSEMKKVEFLSGW